MDSTNYITQLRPGFPHKTEAELELMCASSRSMQLKTGLDAHTHRRRGMEKLFPSRVWHEWRDQRIRSIQECLETRTQELMWLGSSNSNKSADMADSALALWWAKPEMTSIYVASPYETATETGVWAYILEQFDEAKDHNPSLPGKKRFSDNSIVLYDKNPRSFIRIATVDQVGKLVVKKARDFTQGLLVIILDELPAFTASAARALMAVMPNLVSVPNLLVIGAGNFANVWDALGTFCDPDERDIPGGYEGFKPDVHFRWRTKRGGLALRFDGLQSPNVKAGRDIYPFLTTLSYISKLAAGPGGLESPDAMRFIRSAPITSLDEMTVTNGERIRAGGCYDDFEWTSDPITTGAYLDPGFGGDPCVLQKFKLGWQKTTGNRRQIVALWDAPFVIPIRVNALDATGASVTVEDQIVIAARDHCVQHRILPQNFGFDGSLRAGIVQAFGRRWSLLCQAIDSGGSPTDRQVNASEKHDSKNGQPAKVVTWKDRVDRLVSEFWFATASLIDSHQLKGLQHSPKAVSQMTTRRWNWSGKNKRAVETKQEYKDGLKSRNLKPESPNEGDTVVGCVEMSRRLGLSMEAVAPSGGAVQLVLDMIRERTVRSAIKFINRQTELPPGTLHAMKRHSSLPSGRLHR